MGKKILMDYRDASRNITWGANFDPEETETPPMSVEQLACGCLLRIADAVEKRRARRDRMAASGIFLAGTLVGALMMSLVVTASAWGLI